MAKQIEGVYERVIVCAKKEFLEKGFKDASLREIARAADTSTGSIYTRFGDKEGLFREIVAPVAEEMKKRFLEVQEQFHQMEEEKQEEAMPEYTINEQMDILDYIYEYFDEFRMLLDAAYGTEYQHFLDELVQIEVDYTFKYMEVIGCESVKSGVITEGFMHMVATAYLNGMFEVVRHNMSREKAVHYIKMLQRYHMAGYETIFYPENYVIES